MITLTSLANALGGEAISKDKYSPLVRTQRARPKPLASPYPTPTLTALWRYSHTSGDDDWRAIRDYVKERLGSPSRAQRP